MRNSRQHQLKPLVLERFWQRARGLLMRQQLLERDGVLIRPCRSIHTVGMTHSIDVVFLDLALRVTEVRPDIGPFRAITSRCRSTSSTLELAAGEVKKFGIVAGDQISIL